VSGQSRPDLTTPRAERFVEEKLFLPLQGTELQDLDLSPNLKKQFSVTLIKAH
jgi:hypothetical protein